MDRVSGQITLRLWLAAAFLMALAAVPVIEAQQVVPQTDLGPSSRVAAVVVVPQQRAFPFQRRATVEITEVKAGCVILDRAATTTLDISLRNTSSRRLEAELLVPVPDGVAVRAITFQGAASEPSARLLPKAEARRLYESIVARARDPALLEFAGYNLIRSSVFPIEARGTQKVRLTYEHVLDGDGNRVDYVLPRSEAIDYRVPWKVSVKIKSKQAISTVYSPSHSIETKRISAKEIAVRTTAAAESEPGAFRLSYLLKGEGVTASLFAYPDPKLGGGYFLLLAGSPAKDAGGEDIKREVILVLDRSGSMNGEKLEQVREAARQIVAGLEEGETFNILAYNEAVQAFSKEPVPKNSANEKKARQFIDGIRASGGTNIHDALVEALRQKPSGDRLPLILFLTDGIPTIGQTSELAIREIAIKGNPHRRRVFTFGVGVDVNTPLLERIAWVTRATATFILPKEDVEVKVAQVFKKLQGPTLASPSLTVIDAAGKTVPRVQDLMPSQIPDLFDGDQLVVLGVYKGEKPLRFVLTGNHRGKERTFQFSFELTGATTRNAFVPRLWASRRIGYLEDGIRDLGATRTGTAPLTSTTDPRLKELVDEVVRLSMEFGILSEYTAFLALEGTDLTQKDKVLFEANRNFVRRSLRTRSGTASANQDINRVYQKSQSVLNARNSYWNDKLERVAVARVQQISGKTFFRRHGRWVDSLLVEKETAPPKRVIEFGSDAFRELLRRLIKEGRQGCVSLRGTVLLEVDGEAVLVKPPADGGAPAAAGGTESP